MIDIVPNSNGDDFKQIDTQVYRAANILSVQIGNLEYAKDLGIDLDYFLSPDFNFQNSSFQAYLVQVLTIWGVNVTSVVETITTFMSDFTFSIIQKKETTSLISR